MARSLLRHAGPTCIPSVGEARRLDVIYCNAWAQGLVQRANLQWGMGLKTHAVLSVELRVVGNPMVRRRVQPTVWAGPEDAHWAEAGRAASLRLIHEARPQFEQLLQLEDIEGAWQLLRGLLVP